MHISRSIMTLWTMLLLLALPFTILICALLLREAWKGLPPAATKRVIRILLLIDLALTVLFGFILLLHFVGVPIGAWPQAFSRGMDDPQIVQCLLASGICILAPMLTAATILIRNKARGMK